MTAVTRSMFDWNDRDYKKFKASERKNYDSMLRNLAPGEPVEERIVEEPGVAERKAIDAGRNSWENMDRAMYERDRYWKNRDRNTNPM
jgi:hypothetical protein